MSVISCALLEVCCDGSGKLKVVVICACVIPLVPLFEMIVRSSFALVSLPLVKSTARRAGPELVFGLSASKSGLIECAGLCDLENLLLTFEKDVTGGRNSFLISCICCGNNGVTLNMDCCLTAAAWAILAFRNINATIPWWSGLERNDGELANAVGFWGCSVDCRKLTHWRGAMDGC